MDLTIGAIEQIDIMSAITFFFTIAHDKHHAATYILYIIMTSSTTWSPGMLNNWLVYIKRGETLWLSSVEAKEKRH